VATKRQSSNRAPRAPLSRSCGQQAETKAIPRPHADSPPSQEQPPTPQPDSHQTVPPIGQAPSGRPHQGLSDAEVRRIGLEALGRVSRRFDVDSAELPPALLQLIQACANHIASRAEHITQFDTSKAGFSWVRPSEAEHLCKGIFGDPGTHEPQAVNLARAAIARTQEVMAFKSQSACVTRV
jgi:hypothetical protein